MTENKSMIICTNRNVASRKVATIIRPTQSTRLEYILPCYKRTGHLSGYNDT